MSTQGNVLTRLPEDVGSALTVTNGGTPADDGGEPGADHDGVVEE